MSAPPFAYFGGKTMLAPKIAEMLPAHEHYVEPFGGSLALLLAKGQARYETVNDIDGELMTFWRVLRDTPDELARVCALTPHARAEHVASYLREPGMTDLEVARRVWVQLSQGRAGLRRATGWRHYVKPVGTAPMHTYLLGYVERIHVCAERLHAVSLESRPALDLVERYGREPGVLLYVDPPYLGETRSSGSYLHEMSSEQEHADLAAALADCSAAVVLSGYHSPLYDRLYGDWHRVEIQTMTGQGGSNQARTEVLWSNRPLGADHLFSETAS
jgi:DNA adenine methylase